MKEGGRSNSEWNSKRESQTGIDGVVRNFQKLVYDTGNSCPALNGKQGSDVSYHLTYGQSKETSEKIVNVENGLRMPKKWGRKTNRTRFGGRWKAHTHVMKVSTEDANHKFLRSLPLLDAAQMLLLFHTASSSITRLSLFILGPSVLTLLYLFKTISRTVKQEVPAGFAD
ncbi:hypothetical protein Tco_0356280 [Tanacetum coccineum]